MRLSRYGALEWGTATIASAIIVVLLVVLQWWWVIVPVALAWFVVVCFFRDPLGRRPESENPQDFVSPADGTISAVEVLAHHEAVDGPATLIRIFLSVLDVHINRAPAAVRVMETRYRPGKFLDARLAESARVNESNLIMLELTDGSDMPLGVRQVSGAIARHIVCPLKPGDTLQRAQRFGLIKFGSTTELILPYPERTTVRVSVGAKVTGAVTTLATHSAD